MPTIDEIKQQILAEKANYSSLDGADSTSKVAKYNLWAYVTAAVHWVLYQFFETYKQEVDEKIKTQKVLNQYWYREKALEFRYGHPLVESEFVAYYSDEGYTEQEIEDALVVKRAAVVEKEVNTRTILFIKVATENGDGDLEPLDNDQVTALDSYYKRIKTAGTKIVIQSDQPDDLRLTVDFYYDPLVLTETGSRIDGTDNTPVQSAIRNYLKNLPFNGEFSVKELEDILQGLSGCAEREAIVRSAESSFGAVINWQPIDSFIIAESGYMTILDANLTINFIAKTVTT